MRKRFFKYSPRSLSHSLREKGEQREDCDVNAHFDEYIPRELQKLDRLGINYSSY